MVFQFVFYLLFNIPAILHRGQPAWAQAKDEAKDSSLTVWNHFSIKDLCLIPKSLYQDLEILAPFIEEVEECIAVCSYKEYLL